MPNSSAWGTSRAGTVETSVPRSSTLPWPFSRGELAGLRAAQAALPQIRAKIAALQAQRLAQARQAAEAKAAQQREAERKARCAQQTGWLDKLRRDPDCRTD